MWMINCEWKNVDRMPNDNMRMKKGSSFQNYPHPDDHTTRANEILTIAVFSYSFTCK